MLAGVDKAAGMCGRFPKRQGKRIAERVGIARENQDKT